MNKIVNGISVQCSPEEEAAILEEWKTNETRPPEPQKLTDGVLANLLVQKGLISRAEVDQALAQESAGLAT